MYRFPSAIQELINQFNKLPGIGPKTSERFVLHLLRQPIGELEHLTSAIQQLRQTIKRCERCLAITDQRLCSVDSDSQRDQTLICVVADSSQIIPLEKTGVYQGLYFVLGGVLNPIENITPEQLNIKQLVERLGSQKPKIQEVILALNPDVEGESTTIYLRKLLQPLVPKITRLARGLPVGGDLEYADEVTLSSALRGRN